MARLDGVIGQISPKSQLRFFVQKRIYMLVPLIIRHTVWQGVCHKIERKINDEAKIQDSAEQPEKG